jgi:hypothetical protein
MRTDYFEFGTCIHSVLYSIYQLIQNSVSHDENNNGALDSGEDLISGAESR